MNYILTSDLHFGHDFMVEAGHRSPDYEEKIVQNLTETAQLGDIVICLGDVSLYHRGQEAEKEYLSTKKCPHVLVRGNHDPLAQKSLNYGWDFVCDRFDLRWGGVNWVFSHRPIPVPEDSINVHGHLHDGTHRPEEAIYDGRHVLLSQELMDYKPITLHRLSELKATPVWLNGKFCKFEAMSVITTIQRWATILGATVPDVVRMFILMGDGGMVRHEPQGGRLYEWGRNVSVVAEVDEALEKLASVFLPEKLADGLRIESPIFEGTALAWILEGQITEVVRRYQGALSWQA